MIKLILRIIVIYKLRKEREIRIIRLVQNYCTQEKGLKLQIFILLVLRGEHIPILIATLWANTSSRDPGGTTESDACWAQLIERATFLHPLPNLIKSSKELV